MTAPSELPEPIGARPVAIDAFGDAWQRHGPRGAAAWFCTQPGVSFPRGWTWQQVCQRVGPLTLIPRPELPEFPDTTGSIPVMPVADRPAWATT